MRTKKEISQVIALTIKNIRCHRFITDQVIKKECRKTKVSEKTIRIIAKGNGSRIISVNKDD
jgi:hypothetical protein